MVKVTQITLGDFKTAGILTTTLKSARDAISNLNLRSAQNETKESFLGRFRDELIHRKLEKEKKQREKEKKAQQLARKKESIKRNIEKQLNNVKIFMIPNELTDEVGDFASIIKSFTGKNIIVKIEYKGKIVMSTHLNIHIGTWKSWWEQIGKHLFLYPDENSIFTKYKGGKVYIYEASSTLSFKKVVQRFKEGTTNCLLTPILTWAKSKLKEAKGKESKSLYNGIIKKLDAFAVNLTENGVSEEQIAEISEQCRIDISITKPLCDIKFIDVKSSKKRLKIFKFINTTNNHIDLYGLENEHKVLTLSQMLDKKDELRNNNEFHTYTRGLDNVNSITTINTTYNLPNEFFDEISNFEIETGLNKCKIDDIDDKELSKFIKAGTHYNSTIDFNERPDEINHADMETAYTQYKKSKYYKGFLGKITDFRTTNRMEGVGLYQINHLKFSNNRLKEYNDKMHIYLNYNVYTSAELEFLNDNGVTYNILCGCWGVQTMDFDLNQEFMMKKYDGVKGYAKYIGMCDSHHLTKKYYIEGNEEMFNILHENCSGEINFYTDYKRNVSEICIQYPKEHNYHLGHITAQVIAFQRLNVMEQLLSMDMNDIIRVCVDGIYYKNEYKLLNAFRSKTEQTFNNIADDFYVSDLTLNDVQFKCGNTREMYHKELHVGPGGNGKTYYNLVDTGLIKMLYISPSWKLATNKSEEYNCKSNVWANFLSNDTETVNMLKTYYNVLLFDEVSMMTDKQKTQIFNTYSNMRLIFCGDVGFQAPPFSKNHEKIEEINYVGFDKIIHHNQNYRFKCNQLIDLIENIRRMITNKCSDSEINYAVINTLKDRIVDNEYVVSNYKINDMILSRTHAIKDKYTETFKELPKWYITKNSRFFKNGTIVIGDKPDTNDCEIRHSFTIHSIQGETAKHNLYINIEKTYDSRLLYTAISRATRLDQIYLVKN